MSKKWTPGPWTIGLRKTGEGALHGAEGDNFHLIAGPEGDDLGTILEGGLVLADDDTNEANAHLIAAAPELYEALERMVNHFTMLPPDYLTTPDSVIGQALSALSRARGEAL